MHAARQIGHTQPHRRTYENAGQFDDGSCEETIAVIGTIVLPIFAILVTCWFMGNSTRI